MSAHAPALRLSNRRLTRPVVAVTEPRASEPIWVMAVMVALALHGLVALIVIANLNAEEPADEQGAPAIEIGMEIGSPPVEASTLPPGPEAEAAEAAPAVPVQEAKPEETNLPKEVPVESPDAERAVSPDADKPVKDEPPVTRTIQASPSEETVASEATAPPKPENAKETKTSTAPVQGTGATTSRVVVTWQKQLVAHLNRHKRYPARAVRRAAQPVVAFRLDRVGHVVSMEISQSSGDPAFDAAALDMMRRSDPVPAPPPLLADETLSFTVPVIFRAPK